MSFVPGQRVICIESNFHLERNPFAAVSKYPAKGTVYTIREELLDPIYQRWVYVRLCEIVNPTKPTPEGVFEEAFLAECFSPLDEAKIDMFRSLLVTPPKEPVSA